MEGQNYFGLIHDLCLQKTRDKQYNNLIMYVFVMVYHIDICKLSPVKFTFQPLLMCIWFNPSTNLNITNIT